jgi:hypothetical protein
MFAIGITIAIVTFAIWRINCLSVAVSNMHAQFDASVLWQNQKLLRLEKLITAVGRLNDLQSEELLDIQSKLDNVIYSATYTDSAVGLVNAENARLKSEREADKAQAIAYAEAVNSNLDSSDLERICATADAIRKSI